MISKREQSGTEFVCGDLLPPPDGGELYVGDPGGLNSANKKPITTDDFDIIADLVYVMMESEIGDDYIDDEKFDDSWFHDANPALIHRLLCVTINGWPLAQLIRSATYDGSQVVVNDEKDKRRYPNKTPEDRLKTKTRLIEDCDKQIAMCNIAIDIIENKEMNEQEKRAKNIFLSKGNVKWWKPNKARTNYLFKPKKGTHFDIWPKPIACDDLYEVRANILLFKARIEHDEDYSKPPKNI